MRPEIGCEATQRKNAFRILMNFAGKPTCKEAAQAYHGGLANGKPLANCP